ncbi:MAG: hypothetical protein HYX21_01275 [Candidatus Yanofskybacteria bacterium]|nr:hypothetical protein [Candidatus Yanofskybacteria bacterium]
MFFDTFGDVVARFNRATPGQRLRMWPKLYHLGCKTGRFIPIQYGMGLFSSTKVFYEIEKKIFIQLDGFISPVIDWNVTSAHTLPPSPELFESLRRIRPDLVI